MNGVAGSRAERVSVVHIVGTPRTSAQKNKMILHHSLGDGNFRTFAKMYEKVTVGQVDLMDLDAQEMTAAIDKVLRDAIVKQGPVYIQLPTDLVGFKVEGTRLETPIDTNNPPSHAACEDSQVAHILNRLYAAERAILIVDGFVRSSRVSSMARVAYPSTERRQCRLWRK